MIVPVYYEYMNLEKKHSVPQSLEGTWKNKQFHFYSEVVPSGGSRILVGVLVLVGSPKNCMKMKSFGPLGGTADNCKSSHLKSD